MQYCVDYSFLYHCLKVRTNKNANSTSLMGSLYYGGEETRMGMGMGGGRRKIRWGRIVRSIGEEENRVHNFDWWISGNTYKLNVRWFRDGVWKSCFWKRTSGKGGLRGYLLALFKVAPHWGASYKAAATPFLEERRKALVLVRYFLICHLEDKICKIDASCSIMWEGGGGAWNQLRQWGEWTAASLH